VAGAWAALALLAAAPPAGGTVTSYQVDAAHTGNVPGAKLDPPLGRKWIRRDLGEPRTNPLMVEGRVYVLSAPPQQGLMLHALDPATGVTIWSQAAPLEAGATYAYGLTYEDGRIFANGGKAIRAFSAASGETLWTRPLTDSRGAAVAHGGSVFVADGRPRAFRGSDGVEEGVAAIQGLGPHIAADDERIYYGIGCYRIDAYERPLLARLWSHSGCGADSHDDPPPAVYRGRVYGHYRAGGGVVLDAASGSRVGTFSALHAPAFAGNLAFFRGEKSLQAVNLDTGAEAWRYSSADEELAGSPLVAGTRVFVLTRDGELIALDRDSGREHWRGVLSPIVDLGLTSLPLPPPMAAAGDRLIVVKENRITAFGPGPDAPGIDDPDKIPARGLTIGIEAKPADLAYGSKARIEGRASRSVSAHQLQLQSDPHPYGEWRAERSEFPYGESYGFDVKPDRNTRYRVVDLSTFPTVVTETVTVYPYFGGNPSFWVVGRSSIEVRGTFTAPDWLHVTRRRAYLYRSRGAQRSGTRAGSLRVRAAGRRRYRLVGAIRVPGLSRSDRFLVCVPVSRPKAFGRLKRDPCGRRRL
jgi:outer membrane protein assembly factor BamB